MEAKDLRFFKVCSNILGKKLEKNSMYRVNSIIVSIV